MCCHSVQNCCLPVFYPKHNYFDIQNYYFACYFCMDVKLFRSHWARNVGWVNRLLTRIFGPKRDEVTGEWRKLCTDLDNDLYSTVLHIIRVIKSRRMRGGGHAARMGWEGVYTEFWWGNLRERDPLEDLSVDGRIIIKWIFRKLDGAGTGLIWLRIGADGGHL